MSARDMAQQLKRASDREAKMKFEPSITALGNASYRTAHFYYVKQSNAVIKW
jgi:hypothetical protein